MVKKASGGQAQGGATQIGNIKNGLLPFELLLWNNFTWLSHESTWSKSWKHAKHPIGLFVKRHTFHRFAHQSFSETFQGLELLSTRNSKFLGIEKMTLFEKQNPKDKLPNSFGRHKNPFWLKNHQTYPKIQSLGNAESWIVAIHWKLHYIRVLRHVRYWGQTSTKAMEIYRIHRWILFIHHGLTILIARLTKQIWVIQNQAISWPKSTSKQKSSQLFRDIKKPHVTRPTPRVPAMVLLPLGSTNHRQTGPHRVGKNWMAKPLLCSRLTGKYMDASENSGIPKMDGL